MQQIIPNDLTAVATYGICEIHILQEPGRAFEAVTMTMTTLVTMLMKTMLVTHVLGNRVVYIIML